MRIKLSLSSSFSTSLLMFCAIAFILLTVSGCSKNDGGTIKQPSSPPKKKELNVEDDSSALPQLRFFLSDQSMVVPERMERYEQYMNEQVGISLDFVYMPHAQYLDQLHLKFAGGDFPDMYQTWSGPTPDLVSSGKILELNDWIDRYGQNLKRYIPASAWDAVTVQGKIYAVPQPTGTLQGSVMYIRKDWLDKLGLDIPQTSDQLLEVMRAFRDGDPNGNGLADEIPFTMREKLEWGENIFGMWGVNSRYTESYYNDELILGSIHPQFLQGLNFMRTMYAEGLLDRDFLVNTFSIWDQKIASGLVGMWNHAPLAAWRWQQTLEESIPEQNPEVIVIPTPQGAGFDGPVGNRWGIISKTYIVMKDAKDPAALIKWLDWMYSDKGRQFAEYGIEGETYVMGEVELEFRTGSEADVDFLQKVIAAHVVSAEASAAILNNRRAEEKLVMAYEVANTQGFTSETIGMPNIDNDYNLHSLFVEEAALVIIGERTLESYNDFIQLWRSKGGQNFIDERTAWYRENRLSQSD